MTRKKVQQFRLGVVELFCLYLALKMDFVCNFVQFSRMITVMNCEEEVKNVTIL